MLLFKLFAVVVVASVHVSAGPVRNTTANGDYFYSILKELEALPKPPGYIPYIDHEDANLSIPEIIVKYGYPVEVHSITTADGYVLEAHRIPYGKQCGPAEGKRVIWLQHGLLGDSSNWIIAGPDKAFGYVLADQCYDVWMGNFRGNTYSRRHLFLDPNVNQKEFWDHSWNEIGLNDVPANIDYALSVTGAESLYYVGHSMGTTTMWVLLSEKPEYNAKIKLMNAFAPVSYTEHMITPLRLLAPFENQIEWIINMLGLYEFLPSNAFMDFLGKTVCHEQSPVQFVCSNVLFLVAGYNFDQIDPQLLSIAMGHSPAGSSSGDLLHYSQGVNSGLFRKYNYGRAENLLRYGQETPPEYDISKITAPVALYWGQNDWLAAPADVYRLAEQLPNLVKFHRIDHNRFNHLDFVWAIDLNPLINLPTMRFMENY
ncbi:lipase 3 [Folsomia candida]|uniref:lipase 3 n=1 Tax=Folsomia candida TaxID=158441 RepID=UPI000B8F3D71|nr:lipase 3 [Folsomia candida]